MSPLPNVFHLEPGTKATVFTSDRWVPNPYLLKLADGTVYGCTPLLFDGRPKRKAVVMISKFKGGRCSIDDLSESGS